MKVNKSNRLFGWKYFRENFWREIFSRKFLEGKFHSLCYIISLGDSPFVSFNIFYLKGMDCFDSGVSIYTPSTSSSRNNSIHIDEYSGNSSTMNRKSILPLSPDSKDYESNTDERGDEEFQNK